MSKSINWPTRFRDEVIAEDTESVKCAFRLGSIYYDNQYWVDGEEVLVRVNHKVIRRASITGELKKCKINELDNSDFRAQKKSIENVEALVTFLSKNYEQEVTPESEVTVVYYKNHPIDPEIMEVEDDSHMG